MVKDMINGKHFNFPTHLVCLKIFLSELKSSFSSSLDVKLVLELSPKKRKRNKRKKEKKRKKNKKKREKEKKKRVGRNEV